MTVNSTWYQCDRAVVVVVVLVGIAGPIILLVGFAPIAAIFQCLQFLIGVVGVGLILGLGRRVARRDRMDYDPAPRSTAPISRIGRVSHAHEDRRQDLSCHKHDDDQHRDKDQKALPAIQLNDQRRAYHEYDEDDDDRNDHVTAHRRRQNSSRRVGSVAAVRLRDVTACGRG